MFLAEVSPSRQDPALQQVWVHGQLPEVDSSIKPVEKDEQIHTNLNHFFDLIITESELKRISFNQKSKLIKYETYTHLSVPTRNHPRLR